MAWHELTLGLYIHFVGFFLAFAAARFGTYSSKLYIELSSSSANIQCRAG